MTTDLLAFVGISGLPIVVALVQVCKPWVTDERWWPILSLAFGVLLNLGLALVLKTDLPTAAAVGVVAGLAASGLYSTVRAPTKEPPLVPRG